MPVDDQTSRNNLLIISGKTGKVDKLRELLAQGVDINVSDGQGTALQYAAFRGHLDYVKAIVDLGADVSVRSGSGKTAIEWAEQGGHQAIVDFLASLGASTPARKALDDLKRALAEGLDVNQPDQFGATPLHRAVAAGSPEQVELLLASGASVDAATRFGFTPLMLAIYQAQAELVERLFQAGARLPAGPVMLPSKEALVESRVSKLIDRHNGQKFSALWKQRQRAARSKLPSDTFDSHPFWESCGDEDDNTHIIRPVAFLEPLDHDTIGYVRIDATLADGSTLPGYASFDAFGSPQFAFDATPTLWTGQTWIDFHDGHTRPSRDRIDAVYHALARSPEAVFPIRIRSAVELKDQPREGSVEGFSWAESTSDGTTRFHLDR